MLFGFPKNLMNKDNILKYRQELRDYPALSFVIISMEIMGKGSNYYQN